MAALAPSAGHAHPLGNFSISHYAGLRVEAGTIALTYVVDMAEIPTFQELQAKNLIPDPAHPSVAPYLRETIETFARGLHLEVNGARLTLRPQSSGVIFPPGAGDLPTMKVQAVYQASLDGVRLRQLNELSYRDENFLDRAGWKEIIAVAGSPATLTASSVPERDRSQALSDYPTDLLNSPPQDIEARLVFSVAIMPVTAAETPPPGPPTPVRMPFERVARPEPVSVVMSDRPGPALEERNDPAPPAAAATLTVPTPNRQGTPRSAFTQLVATGELSLGVILLAMVTALGVGAAHALEPGHGKAVVAAYLVGSRGTAWHAVFLGLVVTVSHTAGVFLLGLITLYASRYVVPERLYPWLGAVSGLTIAGLGVCLFLQRYARRDSEGDHDHAHAQGHHHHHHGHHHHEHPASPRALLALGITGGILPCPAALVVLLSAIALRRTDFGLLLIVAFSFGLAAVLIVIGLLMVYARRFMARIHGDGPIVRRWLPLASAAVVTVLGVTIALQALIAAGIVQVRL
jgi:ABC-type nickel/cobalt efflux system permease component RcnA